VNIDTGKVYEGDVAVEKAIKRGERLVEVGPRVAKLLRQSREARAEMLRMKRVARKTETCPRCGQPRDPKQPYCSRECAFGRQ
jgi:hypothetical protein